MFKYLSSNYAISCIMLIVVESCLNQYSTFSLMKIPIFPSSDTHFNINENQAFLLKKSLIPHKPPEASLITFLVYTCPGVFILVYLRHFILDSIPVVNS